MRRYRKVLTAPGYERSFWAKAFANCIIRGKKYKANMNVFLRYEEGVQDTTDWEDGLEQQCNVAELRQKKMQSLRIVPSPPKDVKKIIEDFFREEIDDCVYQFFRWDGGTIDQEIQRLIEGFFATYASEYPDYDPTEKEKTPLHKLV